MYLQGRIGCGLAKLSLELPAEETFIRRMGMAPEQVPPKVLPGTQPVLPILKRLKIYYTDVCLTIALLWRAGRARGFGLQAVHAFPSSFYPRQLLPKKVFFLWL